MVTPEPSGHKTGTPEHLKQEKAEQNDLEYNFIKIIEILKEEMRNSFKETEEKTSKKIERNQ